MSPVKLRRPEVVAGNLFFHKDERDFVHDIRYPRSSFLCPILGKKGFTMLAMCCSSRYLHPSYAKLREILPQIYDYEKSFSVFGVVN